MSSVQMAIIAECFDEYNVTFLNVHVSVFSKINEYNLWTVQQSIVGRFLAHLMLGMIIDL